MLLACLLLAGLVPTAQSSLFTGDLAPSNWTVSQFGSYPGGAVFSTGDNPILTFTASSVGASDVILTLSPNLTTGQTISFNWTVSQNGDPGEALAYLIVGGNGGTKYDLVGNSGSKMNITLPASTTIQFEFSADVKAGKAGAQMTITDVPEAGNALAGLLVLGAAGFECFRRKRTAVG